MTTLTPKATVVYDPHSLGGQKVQKTLSVIYHTFKVQKIHLCLTAVLDWVFH